jgi:transcriptional regulator GlxA family with amidase domain
MQIGIVWNQHSIASTAAATVDALRTMNLLAQMRAGCYEPPLRWHWLHTPGDALEGAPVPIPGEAADYDGPLQVLVLPGWLVATGPALRDVSQRHAAHWGARLRQHVDQGGLVAALFNGSSLLAGSGLLAGRKVALPWAFAPSIVLQASEHAPTGSADNSDAPAELQWQRDQAWLGDGSVWTTASPQDTMPAILDLLAHTPLAELARAAAPVLCFEPQRQMTASVALETPTGSPLLAGSLELARRWLQTHRNAPYSLGATARAAATSPRTLLRWFDQVYGQTPQDYLHSLRVAQAQGLLQTTYLTVEDVAQQCGYNDTGSFRKIFTRLSGVTPGSYRRRFSLRTTRKQWTGEPVEGEEDGR